MSAADAESLTAWQAEAGSGLPASLQEGALQPACWCTPSTTMLTPLLRVPVQGPAWQPCCSASRSPQAWLSACLSTHRYVCLLCTSTMRPHWLRTTSCYLQAHTASSNAEPSQASQRQGETSTSQEAQRADPSVHMDLISSILEDPEGAAALQGRGTALAKARITRALSPASQAQAEEQVSFHAGAKCSLCESEPPSKCAQAHVRPVQLRHCSSMPQQ